MAGSSRLVVLAPRALLPGSDLPQAATVEVDTTTGKIVNVHHGLKPELASGAEVLKVDEGKILLPGLIE
jgi:imidazolonepropionase-like amidohydrolase